ncbi:MAG: lycopene cyclase family protein [Bacteroidetes bacterium]|nr:lycopene cyclase family protein [Bacteroidota bacterium]
MPRSNAYDFVFCGAGCGSLSLLVRMLRSGHFNDKKILLIDKDTKTKNDRTWCFWEKDKGFFEEIVYHQWDTIAVHGDGFSTTPAIAPYRYKMIRGIDFYEYCFSEISRHSNVEVVMAEIGNWEQQEGQTVITLNGQPTSLGTPVLFNSLYIPATPNRKSLRLLQHFKGWLIETDQPAFDPKVATMMDFRAEQKEGTTFVYVMPFSTTKALVEYTLFSKALLQPAEYDKGLNTYITEQLGIKDYRIIEEEAGIIPMTNEKLSFKGRGWQIGTAGGQTKGSSGYTFQFIQKQSEQILQQLLKGASLDKIPSSPGRFRFYDNTLLDILYHDTLPGDKIFTRLFKKNKPQRVLRFLDNETSLSEELKIISSLPTWPFLKAALKQL